jgi:exopolyphosphatase/guanosine-5'-triphosphate,3'-diphosphate pyrophosphatase
LPEIDLRPKGRSLECIFPKGWLEAHPLTAADLEQEAEFLRGAGFRLRAG